MISLAERWFLSGSRATGRSPAAAAAAPTPRRAAGTCCRPGWGCWCCPPSCSRRARWRRCALRCRLHRRQCAPTCLLGPTHVLHLSLGQSASLGCPSMLPSSLGPAPCLACLVCKPLLSLQTGCPKHGAGPGFVAARAAIGRRRSRRHSCQPQQPSARLLGGRSSQRLHHGTQRNGSRVAGSRLPPGAPSGLLHPTVQECAVQALKVVAE